MSALRATSLPLVLLLPASLLACREATSPEVPPLQIVLPADLEQSYRVDAARLAVRELGSSEDLKALPPEIPTELVASLFNALVRVHATSLPARNRVVEAGIHTFPQPDVFEMLVKLSPDAVWAAAWRQGAALTGNPAVDQLVTRYQLRIEHYYLWTFGEYVVLRSAEPVNTAGLARRLSEVPGILLAEPNGWGGDGNDITARRDGDAWRLRYLLKWGDCPAGCISSHYWEFRVRESGAVTYLGEGDGKLP